MSDVPERWLVGVRLRPEERPTEYLVEDASVHVGDLVVVEHGDGTAVGEVRRPRRDVPEVRRDRPWRRVVRAADPREAADHRERLARERAAVLTCQQLARTQGLELKIVDVELPPGGRRVAVHFTAEARVDFRGLVRELARHFRARVEMRQIGARDTTRRMDGIGPCGRQLCCSGHLERFEPISIKMAKAQDFPLTDARLLGNCGRLKCCLLYEFSMYQELRARLPRVNTPCQAQCGGGGCMAGKVKSVQVLAEAVVVGFPDGTTATVPLGDVTWEGRPHVTPRAPDA